MTGEQIVILVVAGLAVGFINTLAGGGSVISLTVLMLLGLPANVANGTNRVAILIQNIGAVGNFSKHKTLDSKKGLLLAIPAVVGAMVGAGIATHLPEEVIRKAIAWVLVLMFFVLLVRPKRWIEGAAHLTGRPVQWWQYVLFFFIGIYGGFIHVGVGYMLLAGIVLGAGYDLVKANAIKVFIILLWTPLSLLVFWLDGQVNWIYGLILGIGNFTGALIASQIAVKKGANFVRWIVLAIILVMTLHMFGVIDLKSVIGL